MIFLCTDRAARLIRSLLYDYTIYPYFSVFEYTGNSFYFRGTRVSISPPILIYIIINYYKNKKFNNENSTENSTELPIMRIFYILFYFTNRSDTAKYSPHVDQSESRKIASHIINIYIFYYCNVVKKCVNL
jgi:hypothetical protein